jgi:F-type H+-transporting ATPase subunit epsilon
MTDTFTFELVSPEKLLVSKPAVMVTVPGSEGEYGVLPMHAAMITTLKPGVIQIYEEDTTTPNERIFVAGGFAEVTSSRFTVLATEATPVANLNRPALQEEAKALATQITSAEDAALEALQVQQEIVAAKIDAAA